MQSRRVGLYTKFHTYLGIVAGKNNTMDVILPSLIVSSCERRSFARNQAYYKIPRGVIYMFTIATTSKLLVVITTLSHQFQIYFSFCDSKLNFIILAPFVSILWVNDFRVSVVKFLKIINLKNTFKIRYELKGRDC